MPSKFKRLVARLISTSAHISTKGKERDESENGCVADARPRTECARVREERPKERAERMKYIWMPGERMQKSFEVLVDLQWFTRKRAIGAYLYRGSGHNIFKWQY